MKKLVTGLLVLSLLGSSASFAEARDGRRDRDRDGDRREHNERNWRNNDGERHWRRGDHDGRRYEGRRHQRRWNWTRGNRFDWHYFRPHYRYVDNWSYYHLRRPPRGYRWVRVDGDFLLVALATGIILEIFAHNNDYYYDDYYYGDYYYR
jgi:Ni/Co efflux regulator RcnB